jgi:Fe-S-cluster containining protein
MLERTRVRWFDLSGQSEGMMERYRNLLKDVSDWFATVQARHPRQMGCGNGCILCCCGLFDISVADALHVTSGLEALPAATRAQVIASAGEIQDKILKEAPELKPPFLLKASDEAVIDRIAARIPGVRCPCLGAADECLIYSHRPLACRLEGVPMVDLQDGLFGDWCELNFPDGVSLAAEEDLQRDYYKLQDIERTTTADISESLLGRQREYFTILIPSLIVGYQEFWAPLLAKQRVMSHEY